MKAENELPPENQKAETDKDALSQEELRQDVKMFEGMDKSPAALETPDGKNNGAQPAVFRKKQKWHT